MSKIGTYNLQLQERANELGFETVQEALDAGYEVVGDCSQPLLAPKKDEDLQELAHEDWLKERDQVIEELSGVGVFLSIHHGDTKAIDHAIEFIKRGEV